MYTDLFILIGKCLLVGIIWATFLLPVIFDHGNVLKYVICVIAVAILCYFFRGYAYVISQMTVIALIALILSWITSMAFFSNEAKIKSKVIAFSSIIAIFASSVLMLFRLINLITLPSYPTYLDYTKIRLTLSLTYDNSYGFSLELY